MLSPEPKQLYKHYKGLIYRIVCVSKMRDSKDTIVSYYDVEKPDKKWCLTLEDFSMKVDRCHYPECEQKYKFELIEKTRVKNLI